MKARSSRALPAEGDASEVFMTGLLDAPCLSHPRPIVKYLKN
jgi:hypothetical protein